MVGIHPSWYMHHPYTPWVYLAYSRVPWCTVPTDLGVMVRSEEALGSEREKPLRRGLLLPLGSQECVDR